MTYLKDIQEEIEKVLSLRELSEVYGEIAAIRMKKIRKVVLANRNFISAIDKIFKDVLAEYANKLSQLIKEGKLKKGSKVTFLAHNGKTVAVLISSNTGFFGDVVRATFDKFLDHIRKENVEATIVGRMGFSMFIQEEPKRQYTFFDLPDYGFETAKMAQIIKHLVAYEKIVIFYGQYQSIVTQKPNMTSITAGTPVSENVPAPKVRYIFEPNIEKILMFFETQIFASLFDQSIRESQLAKFASRILAMDQAYAKIGDKIASLNLQKLRQVHEIANDKQINSLGPIAGLGS